MDRYSTREVTAALQCEKCTLKYNLIRVSDYSVLHACEHGNISTDDSASVLDLL